METPPALVVTDDRLPPGLDVPPEAPPDVPPVGIVAPAEARVPLLESAL
jgi:hypothetical protein